MKLSYPCFLRGFAVYLLVQYEIKNELGAKGFNLEACLGQVDSLNAKRGGNLKDVYRTSTFYVDILMHLYVS